MSSVQQIREYEKALEKERAAPKKKSFYLLSMETPQVGDTVTYRGYAHIVTSIDRLSSVDLFYGFNEVGITHPTLTHLGSRYQTFLPLKFISFVKKSECRQRTRDIQPPQPPQPPVRVRTRPDTIHVTHHTPPEQTTSINPHVRCRERCR